ncbi:helix-turn-helix domain-containing protein [Jatrophihabitans sp.]|uniref:PucR family transcriptional regulator n=1 Tax=Jatrophihabitans sp. TaxID=1932789 RepID=UPI0030C6A035
MTRPDEVQRLVDDISHLLAAPTTLESRDFELIAFCAHDADGGDGSAGIDPVRMHSILGRGSTLQTRAWFEAFGIATATCPVRTPAAPELGIRPRLCLPVRHRRRLLGYVWLLDAGELDPAGAEVAAAVVLTERLAELLAARESTDVSAALADALTGAGARRAEALRVLAGQLGGVPAVVVATAVGPGIQLDGQRVQLLPAASPVAAPAGVSSPFTDLAQLRRAHRQAAYAARVAEAMPTLGPVLRWDELGAYRLLRDVPADDPEVTRLVAALADVPELLDTAEVYLDHAGNVQAAAAALFIHRQTLYHRIARIEALTGLTLTSGTDRLLLHLAVKVTAVKVTRLSGSPY